MTTEQTEHATAPAAGSGRRFMIGSPVHCQDGVCGELALVVVDPVADRLAHLIVVPQHGEESRLVPVGMARAEPDRVVLDCTREEFTALEPAVRTHFIQAEDPEAADPRWRDWGYRHDELVAWPMFGLGPTGAALSLANTPGPPMPHLAIEDRVPRGEIRIRRGEHVHAEDGPIGRVRGLVVDPADGSVTHVLLDEGHLWGRKQVAIPIGAVSGITPDGVSVRLLRRQIKDLPAVELAGEQGDRT